jgi:flavin-dependent dehydrogenase
MDANNTKIDVLVIGAGPSGAIAAALLVQRGYRVLVLEKEQFPRFSIGESLLPQCMEFIAEAGMTDVVNDAAFQFKNGATFHFNGEKCSFDFTEKFSPGPGTTFQVQRARFDKLLADEAERQGADIRYQHEITEMDISGDKPKVSFLDPEGNKHTLESEFVLDASGFGRVLPRLLDLNTPSSFPVRQSLFTHVADNISMPGYDREKILINIHPKSRDVWYWLIPFSEGRASIGVVAEPHFMESFTGDNKAVFKEIIAEDPWLNQLLGDAQFDMPIRTIVGYSSNVTRLYGKGFALLGNAGEFLDPVFSSGVTIAMKSASMAASLLDKQFKGESVDWENDFEVPLKAGVNTFRTFVNAWYDLRFQDVIFHDSELQEVKQMICSILAGYAWDDNNPYVKHSERRLNVVAEICKRG